ncbi:MAG: glycosyltransferase family 39 protein, partial [Sedimenticolaceae bacterium]
MWQRLNLAWLIIAFVVLRLVSMIWVPLADTSEPRYAEIARLMAVSNDWITPYFEPGVPFWGKPPLSFWTQAISFKIFGINEFAARLPSLLATLATAWMLWLFAMFSGGRRLAGYTAVIYGSGALVFVTAGAVLTDPFLVLGTTWSMAAFFLAPKHNSWFWRYGFFLGLAIGLLSKGPLAPVLTFGPIIIWLIQSPTRRVYISALPWLKGLLLMLVISLPWYIAAELKTPGFLNYFIVGEHFMRFIDPGWSGDLYGNAHNQPKGMIWPQWFVASFPWGLIAIAMLLWQLRARQG